MFPRCPSGLRHSPTNSTDLVSVLGSMCFCNVFGVSEWVGELCRQAWAGLGQLGCVCVCVIYIGFCSLIAFTREGSNGGKKRERTLTSAAGAEGAAGGRAGRRPKSENPIELSAFDSQKLISFLTYTFEITLSTNI